MLFININDGYILNKSGSNLKLIGSVSVLLCLIVICVGVYITFHDYNINSINNETKIHELRGTSGDFWGGHIGAVFNVASFLLLFSGLLFQSIELKQSINEQSKSRKEFEEQTKLLEEQNSSLQKQLYFQRKEKQESELVRLLERSYYLEQKIGFEKRTGRSLIEYISLNGVGETSLNDEKLVLKHKKYMSTTWELDITYLKAYLHSLNYIIKLDYDLFEKENIEQEKNYGFKSSEYKSLFQLYIYEDIVHKLNTIKIFSKIKITNYPYINQWLSIH